MASDAPLLVLVHGGRSRAQLDFVAAALRSPPRRRTDREGTGLGVGSRLHAMDYLSIESTLRHIGVRRSSSSATLGAIVLHYAGTYRPGVASSHQRLGPLS
jgi:hypothetical protein